VDLIKFFENVLELVDIDFDPITRFVTVTDQVLLKNNTFEKEAAFLHVIFNASAFLINNRFHSTLDLTAATFTTPASTLCLSFNRIGRFVLQLEHLGNLPNVSPYDLLIYKPLRSLFTYPLETSRVRQAVEPDGAAKCGFVYMTKSNPKNANANRYVEHLDDIYRTVGQSFREANDQGGVNEAWYLQTIAKRDQTATTLDTIWAWISWGFGDIPSRYTVDVWRTVWVSIMIMLLFYIFYLVVLRRLVWSNDPDNHQLQIPTHPAKQRAFRIRLFEPIHISSKTKVGQEGNAQCVGRFPCQRNHRVTKTPGYHATSVSGRYRTNVQAPVQDTRRVIPWRDAWALSFRSFTKIGLGASYPNTRLLKFLTGFEWALGVYMLIHFILAVKNNLPFIAPFLGVVN
jgi:hypothetical protein